MPFNLTSLQPVKDLLREIAGEEAAKVMPTPTFSLCVNEQGQMILRVSAGKVSQCGSALTRDALSRRFLLYIPRVFACAIRRSA